jgi:cytochrome c556
MQMIRISSIFAVAAVALVAGVAVAVAQDDIIGQRRALMRDNAKQERTANNVILGKFLPEKAEAAMQKLEDNLALFITLFPDGTETGGETHADPAIWIDRAAFVALAADFIERAEAARLAVAEGQGAFSVAWQPVAEACAGCHGVFAPSAGFR